MEQEKRIQLDGMDCYILVDNVIKGDRYLYVAELEDEDTNGNFYLYKVLENNQYERIVQPDQLKRILPAVIAIMNGDL